MQYRFSVAFCTRSPTSHVDQIRDKATLFTMAFVTLSSFVLTLVAAQLLHILYTVFVRVVVSPLASFPGPKLAALTSWYECYYDVFKPGQYVFKIKQLHEEYGKF